MSLYKLINIQNINIKHIEGDNLKNQIDVKMLVKIKALLNYKRLKFAFRYK